MTPSELPRNKKQSRLSLKCSDMPHSVGLVAVKISLLLNFKWVAGKKVIARHKTLFLSHIRKVSFPVVKPETHILFCNFFTRKLGSFVYLVLCHFCPDYEEKPTLYHNTLCADAITKYGSSTLFIQ